MSKTLQKQHRMDARTLDPNRYTETLLSSAYECGMYDDETVLSVRGGLFDLLSARLSHMTNGESCSVSAETAQAVLSAVLYTLDMRLLSEPDPDCAAELLAAVSVKTLFEEGLHLIKRRLRAAEVLYLKQLPLFRNLPDSVMKTTAVDGIAGFFRAYRPDGLADNIPITADYPLYLDMNMLAGMRGVSFLARYLQGLSDEARFLSKFRADTLHAVLSASDPLYRATPANLFAPLYANALGMAMLNRPFSAWKYGLQGNDIDAIRQMYDDGLFTLQSVERAAVRINDLLMLEGTTADYVRRSSVKTYETAIGCLRRHMPMLVFPCTDAEYRNNRRGHGGALYEDIAFRLALGETDGISYRGGRMDAESFRCLDFDLRACTAPEQKTEMILSRVHGLEDICDLLISDTGVMDDAEKEHLLAALPTEARQYLCHMMGEAQ